MYFGWVFEPADSRDVSITMTKVDDAVIDLSLWGVRGDGLGMESAQVSIHVGLHSQWQRRLTKEAVSWLQASKDQAEWDAVQDSLVQVAGSTWWNWADGSRFFFWRCP